MQHNITQLILVATLALFGSSVFADKSDTASVKDDLNALFAAMIEGNAEGVIDKTHPVLIEAVGGRDVLMQVAAQYFASPQFKAMEIEDVTITEPFTFITTDDNRYVIVPATMTTVIEGTKYKVKSYQLGIYDTGTKSWKYLDGSKMKRETIKRFFPDFPDGAALPTVGLETSEQ